ncbi:MAG: thiamine-phosphate kinase, partial [Polyangiaceae bacterium]
AAIDLSDGLAADTAQLALASGVAIMLDPAAVLLGLPADVAGEVGADPLDLALYGGEDYALLLTAPPGSERNTWRRIGRCVAAEGMASAVYLERKGTAEPIEVRGFDHFAPKT